MAESSIYDLHPIQQSLGARSWKIPLVFSLTLTPLVIYGLSVLPLSGSSVKALDRLVNPVRRSVTLVLEEAALRPGIRPPTTRWIGPPGPGGLGHKEGTSTIDARLLAVRTPIISFPTEAIDPDQLGQSLRADPVSISLNPALPTQPGGNGLSKGTGNDPARGKGGLSRLQEPVAPTLIKDKQGKVPDGRLVPIRRQFARHVYRPGQWGQKFTKVKSIVRVLIDEKGSVIATAFISGPEELREDLLWAASLWLFEPLGPHGLQAPLVLDLVFDPQEFHP